METSAKQDIHIDDAFYGIVREIRKLNQVKSKNRQFHKKKKELFLDSCNCILM